MALDWDDSTPNFVDKMEFLSALDSLKEQQKTSKFKITKLFLDDSFYELAKTHLVATEKKNSHGNREDHDKIRGTYHQAKKSGR